MISVSPKTCDKKIERISEHVAEKISTAQVVVSLSSAIRQLLDNAIDAGATVIDIRLKNNGYDRVEVQDNGCGIEKSNFNILCKPHSTSKLAQLSDFENLVTLGFRGEALNALCAISTVTIFTRGADSDIGSCLTFDHQGNMKNHQSAAREIGTTVHVEHLFETLPVRRKEFERSAKRECMKMLKTIQSFALLCPKIKILCTNLAGGKKLNLICTPGGTCDVRDVILNLFGVSKKLPLVEIQEDSPTEEVLSLYSVPVREKHMIQLFKVRGFISGCEHGSGRSTSDRQFVYINDRPVEFPKVCSIINEAYKQFNKSQYPVIVLFIDVPSETIDVNVTPDKKTVIVEKENILFACIRASVLKTMSNIVGTHSTVNGSVEDRRKMVCAKNSVSWFPVSDTFVDRTTSLTILTQRTSVESKNNIDESMGKEANLVNTKDDTRDSPPSKKLRASRTSNVVSVCQGSAFDKHSAMSIKNDHEVVTKKNYDTLHVQDVKETDVSERAAVKQTANCKPPIGAMIVDFKEIARTQQKVRFSIKGLREAYVKVSVVDPISSDNQRNKRDILDELTSGIGTESFAESETKLSRSLRKNEFLEMEVIGQFNKGFIICNIRSHLFIVDQHASDEKYNFEKLQKRAKLTRQPLLTPVPLSFGTVQEMIIRENLQIFQANGFDFEFRLNNECMKTFLTARPEIMSQTLTLSDLEEILAAVSEYPRQMYRPIRIRSVFASRACRKSVMIGRSLNQREMRRILKHLASLDQPWNCPHGRPTIRHLVSLKHPLADAQ